MYRIPALKVVCPQSRLPSKSSALKVVCPQSRGLNVAALNVTCPQCPIGVIFRVFLEHHKIFLHAKFQGGLTPPSGFCLEIPLFWQICDGNIFPSNFVQFFTSQRWKNHILIKIEQKLGLYF